MESPFFNDIREDIEPSFITPDHVRGLSLGKVTEKYGTPGLYVRTLDTITGYDLGDDLVVNCLQLGLALHSNDFRTSGHYVDHLMRVMLHIVEDFGIRDRNIIAAAPLHDVIEDHPIDLTHTLTGEFVTDRATVRRIGYAALARFANEDVADMVLSVSNPDVRPGQDKNEVYTDHVKHLVDDSPRARVIKLADFIDNASGNHATVGDKRPELDKKYLAHYRIHRLGLFMPDSLITGSERQVALDLLSRGHSRALGRIALTGGGQSLSPSFG